ncbi:MAG: thiamine biosynthesis protein ThiJ [Okeania sp. SIO2G4]|uniref:DJ-1/PfpI family protein n=1 Tax=unclassified Okeania TaxID=2634635 RepID=UPI0013BC5FA8|nr:MULTISPECIES: DJ-1/PfpI family protein [unclassified Okeania]NEP39533.1 thiamine biosynthesis protein ThiJ [Okeania sp. SIO2H7]NEP72754.1 thiamine biosynthesis protein ThiJ [Okeania sp. SIO2G5]NEP93389.1 thiamine biosynthesis protein ThiJ [Okeania sp. SIO2F5]NEQ91401.1 thiamine biosynthesis protein ThiJ [Okeania sp. SIO2G4]
MATATKGKIGVLIEDHFDPTEYLKFNEFFPQKGYEVEYITHLWGNKELHFGSNPENNIVGEQVTVSTEVNDVNPSDYKGIICIGAYAMDRLRYQVNPKKGEPNQAPAVAFLRKAVNTENVKLGAICHSLWLFCADNEMIKNKKVTCAHNIICDVENAGADVIFDGDQTADLVIDGNLITAKHPGVTDEFMEKFVEAIEA